MNPTRISKREARRRLLDSVRITEHPSGNDVFGEHALAMINRADSRVTDFGETFVIHVPSAEYRLVVYSK